jgi:hypothetical protein
MVDGDGAGGVVGDKCGVLDTEDVEDRGQLVLVVVNDEGAGFGPIRAAVAHEVEGHDAVRGEQATEPVVDPRVIGEAVHQHERRLSAWTVAHIEPSAVQCH